MSDRAGEYGEQIHQALWSLIRELLDRRPGGHLIEPRIGEIVASLRLPKAGGDEGEPFADRLVASLEELLDDAIEQEAAFRPGHAFCHRCSGTRCEHTQPPSSRHVLTGYAPTGLPVWVDFAQLCLERRLPEVDRLYRTPPAFLTLLQGRDELGEEVIQAFRTRSQELLAQVAAGFFPVPSRLEEGRGVLALTFQVAASHGRKGNVRLGLNILGRSPSGEDLAALWDRQRELPWRRPVRWAQGALQTVRLPRGSKNRDRVPDAAYERVEAILRGLVRRLERELRSRGRRTRHADERHESGERPTRKAVDDTRAASTDDVLVDARSGTRVILGGRGRTHFFTEDGRLVSSVRYSREAIERKRKLGHWRDASRHEAEKLRESVLKDTG
ncbi:hypothetical protein ABI59_06240 [Acidobacteria bacterium Mor1]|nr:hypothetical protein ABI59_06240 [Acidobacteria bacterium Mor1]